MGGGGTNTEFKIEENAPGGKEFDKFGTKHWKDVLRKAKIFCRENFEEVKDHSTVTLVIVESLQGGSPAATTGNRIQLSSTYINHQLEKEIRGVIYHESVHVWQNAAGDRNDPKLYGVVEGVADWIRLRADLAHPHWSKKPSPEEKWFAGYATTAYFLDWICNHHNKNFVKLLNKKMKNSWNEDFFQQIVGKKADELWTEYLSSFKN